MNWDLIWALGWGAYCAVVVVFVVIAAERS